FGLGRADRVHRQLRDLLLDLLDDPRVADLTAPVGVDEPTALLGAPAARLVVGLGVRDVLELRLLLAADLPAVLATRLEPAARWWGDEIGGQARDRQSRCCTMFVGAWERTTYAPAVQPVTG